MKGEARLVLVGLLFALFWLWSNPVIQAEEIRLRLATTTSTENTGLLEVLNPPFEKMMNIKIDVIPVGTGKALRMGATGDVDVVLVHARKAEDEFVNDGYGVNRRDVMYNDFVIIGPEVDPAGIKRMANAKEAFKKIAEAQVPFISRGDDSGTHKRELMIWKKSGDKARRKMVF